MPQEIEIEASSLAEVRERFRQQMPEGCFLLVERLLCDGQSQVTRAEAGTVEAALAQAKKGMPPHAEILETRILVTPRQVDTFIAAYHKQEAEAQAIAQAKLQLGPTARLQSLKPLKSGRFELPAMGKRLHEYEATLAREATVEVTYKPPARATFLLLTREELLATIGEAGDPVVRQAAIKALPAIGDPDTIQPLLCALDDEDLPLSHAAAEALGGMLAQGSISPAQMGRGLPAILDKIAGCAELRKAVTASLIQNRDPHAVRCIVDDVRRATADGLPPDTAAVAVEDAVRSVLELGAPGIRELISLAKAVKPQSDAASAPLLLLEAVVQAKELDTPSRKVLASHRAFIHESCARARWRQPPLL